LYVFISVYFNPQSLHRPSPTALAQLIILKYTLRRFSKRSVDLHPTFHPFVTPKNSCRAPSQLEMLAPVCEQVAQCCLLPLAVDAFA
jgi:hypothetical protein